MLRRFASLATWLLLLRVNVVAVDTTCARHEAQPAHATHAQTADHAAAHDHGTSDSQSSESCEQPVRADCCRALASCSFTLDLGAVGDDDETIVRFAEASTLGSSLPASHDSAPEPPPPRT